MEISCRPPIHPGEIIREDYLAPEGLSSGRFAKALGVPRTRIERIVRERTGISADTALRLARYFGTTADFWMNLQKRYELDCARADAALEAELARITPREAA